MVSLESLGYGAKFTVTSKPVNTVTRGSIFVHLTCCRKGSDVGHVCFTAIVAKECTASQIRRLVIEFIKWV